MKVTLVWLLFFIARQPGDAPEIVSMPKASLEDCHIARVALIHLGQPLSACYTFGPNALPGVLLEPKPAAWGLP